MKTSTKTLDVIYDEISDRHKEIIEVKERLDTKLTIIIGFIGITIGFILDFKDNLHQVSLILILIPIVISFITAFLAYFPRKFKKVPRARGLFEKYLDASEERVKIELIKKYIEAIEANREKYKLKKNLSKSSFIFLLIGLMILCINILLS